MSIELFTGFVGSGKSYAATKIGTMIADAPASKKYVIANFPIKPKRKFLSKVPFIKKYIKEPFKKCRWIFKDNNSLTVDFLISESLARGWNKKEGSALVIFDEASIPFNARSFQRGDRMKWIEFLTQSRKFGYDIIFITQDARMLDKQIRALCEYEVVHKKLNNMFALKWLSLFRLTLFAGVSYWNGLNAKYSKGQLRLYTYHKSIADRYDTLRLFNLVAEGEEGKMENKGVPS